MRVPFLTCCLETGRNNGFSRLAGRGAALYSLVLTSTSVCPAQVIATIKILLLISLHPPRFAGNLPRSPICLHSAFLWERQEEPLLVGQ